VSVRPSLDSTITFTFGANTFEQRRSRPAFDTWPIGLRNALVQDSSEAGALTIHAFVNEVKSLGKIWFHKAHKARLRHLPIN
jgi:hypothetical protein